MLHGAMVLTEHPRARILKIHVDEAAAMPGVVRVFTAADVPGIPGTRASTIPISRCSSPKASSPAASPTSWRWSSPTRSSTRARPRRRFEGRLRGPRAAHRSIRGTEAGRAARASGGYLRPASVEHPAADDRVLPRRRRRGAGDRRARHRGDVRHAADRDRIPRTGSVPRACRRATASR